MSITDVVGELVSGFDTDVFIRFLRAKFSSFSGAHGNIPMSAEFPWQSAERIGVVKTLAGPNGSNMPMIVVVAELRDGDELHERSSRVRQFNFSKKCIEDALGVPPDRSVAGAFTQGLFVFYDGNGNFRLSLVYGKAEGTRLVWSAVKRQSFFVDVAAGNKTFRDRMVLDCASFDKLKEAFSVEKLTKEFYNRLFAWYQWALSEEMNVTYPNDTDRSEDDREINEHIIRLITRLMFVWFLKQKHLVPDNLFDPAKLKTILKKFSPTTGDNYYRAILQNLFFATLNSEIAERAFAVDAGKISVNKEHFGIKTLYRYGAEFSGSENDVLSLFSKIPFLNGGLFECLDKDKVYFDGFSRNPKKQALVPNRLFFDEQDGLIPLLQQYNFTVDENAPGDEDVALDPELLGKVFENLLGAYNPETKIAARKVTGSFYTPREIVNYMVDESLIAHLTGKCGEENADVIRKLFADGECPTDKALCEKIDTALVTAKILDPACGSGAFPMGVLLRMVELLRILRSLPADQSVYELKLELIENCIYGGDIQCIAVQISKLRFFISLVCEQKPTTNAKDNYGIHTLPNLETKFVAADSLIGLPKSGTELPMQNVEAMKKELWAVRHRHFLARSYQEKKDLRKEDKALREKLAKELEHGGGFDTASAKLMADWDPYDQNTSATFSDPEWMFNVKAGFDITIGNPPYVRADEQSDSHQAQRKAILNSKQYDTLWQNWDLYVPFIERGYKLLRAGGVSTMIVSDAFCHSKYAQKAQNWLLQNARILRLDFCAELRIFDAAVHNVITFLQKTDGSKWKPDRRLHKGTFGNVMMLPSDIQDVLTHRAFFPEDNNFVTFSAKTLCLDEIFYIAEGMHVNSDEKLNGVAFKMEDVVAAEKDKTHPKPFVEGKHLQKWVPISNRWLEWGTKRAPQMFRRKTFPEIYAANVKILVQRSPGPDPKCCYDENKLHYAESVIGFCPWNELHGVRNNSLKKVARYQGEQPLRPELAKREYLEATSKRFSVKYLLGVMNSSSAREFLRANRRSNIHLYANDWKNLPIPDVTFEQQKPIIELVNQILASKLANPSAVITLIERQIDVLVAMLFGAALPAFEIAKGGVKLDGQPEGAEAKKVSASSKSNQTTKNRKAALPPSLPGWD